MVLEIYFVSICVIHKLIFFYARKTGEICILGSFMADTGLREIG
jgi:hypothetical protein